MKKCTVHLIIFSAIFMTSFITKAAALPPYLAYYVGPITSKSSIDAYKSWAWGCSYVYRSASPFGWSFNYANEGHLPMHFRDGVSLQAVLHAEPFFPNWSFAAAAGPYAYFDTVFFPGTKTYYNRHGLGLKLDLMTTYDYSPVVLFLGISHVQALDSFHTTALISGVGYSLDLNQPTPRPLDEKSNELTINSGKSLVDAGFGETQHAVPTNIDYRHHFPRIVDWSVSLLHEGATTLSNRDGLAVEIWARKNFFSDRLSLSMGVGPYIARERVPTGNQRTVSNGLISASASYLLYKPWLTSRITWHRVFTTYNRDSDLFLLGLGINF